MNDDGASGFYTVLSVAFALAACFSMTYTARRIYLWACAWWRSRQAQDKPLPANVVPFKVPEFKHRAFLEQNPEWQFMNKSVRKQDL